VIKRINILCLMDECRKSSRIIN